MAKKAASSSGKSDRTDPKQNKSLAIRSILKKMPNARATEIKEAVKQEYGHDVAVNLIYMLKTKGNIKAGRKQDGAKGGTSKASGNASPMNSAATWVEAIKIAKQLLTATGSVENATALLKAIDAK